MKKSFSKLLLVIFAVYSFPAWGEDSAKGVKLRNNIYHARVEDMEFTSECMDEKASRTNKYQVKKLGPLEASSVSYYDLSDPNAEKDSIGIQLNLLECCSWIKSVL